MKNNTGLIVILLILILMAVTNTTKEDYIDFVKEKYVDQVGRDADRGFIAEIETTFIKNTTQVKNYILFSLYKTDIGEDNLEIIGAFRNFVFIPNKEALLLALGIVVIAAIAITFVIRYKPEENSGKDSV